MTLLETASLLTSEIEFADLSGAAISDPLEWQRGYVVLPTRVENLTHISVSINGRHVGASVVLLRGEPRVVVPWERAGPGWYNIELLDHDEFDSRRVRVDSSKITRDSFESMLADLEHRLPVTIAIALRDSGARIAVNPVPPEEQTLATEVARLRKAIEGQGRPGLVEVLHLLATNPHEMLSDLHVWTRSRDARRPNPGGLVQSIWKPNNLEDGRPKRVLDRRVAHTVDLYENRVLKAFVREVEGRLRRLSAVLSESADPDLKVEVDQLLRDVSRERRSAEFLNEVGPLRTSPNRVTMVLLKRFEYRAAYEGFLDFRRNRSVHLDEPALNEPLRNLPYLYQLWCTLTAIEEVALRMGELGWRIKQQRLVVASPSGTYVKVLKDGKPALVMTHPDGRTLRLIPERSYGTGQTGLRSVSFSQRPDIAIELISGEKTEVVLLDPKYKLVSEEGGEPGDGTPKKDDVDKMHAYRDSIRSSGGQHVVRHAALLYPGRSVQYGEDVSAIRAYPGSDGELRRGVRSLIEELVGG